jgi:hypothetical protein
MNETISQEAANDGPQLTEELLQYCFNISKRGAPPTPPTVFWLEGVALTSTGIIGIIGNTVTVLVLNRISLSNVFNQVTITRSRRYLYPVHLLVIPMYICTSHSLFSHSYLVNE